MNYLATTFILAVMIFAQNVSAVDWKIASSASDESFSLYADTDSVQKRIKSEEMMENLIKTYFKAFSNKDLHELEGLFSNEVILKDWDIYAEGKQDALLANKKIFDSVDSISADLKELYLDGLVAVCIIEITINKDEVLKVIDIIKFDDQKKIKEVSAYKQ